MSLQWTAYVRRPRGREEQRAQLTERQPRSEGLPSVPAAQLAVQHKELCGEDFESLSAFTGKVFCQHGAFMGCSSYKGKRNYSGWPETLW